MLKDHYNYTHSYIYVYELANRVKIGFTTNNEKRRKSLESVCGERIKRMYYRPGTYFMEQIIHASLNDKIIAGEFYNMSYEDAVKYVDGILDMSKDFETDKIHYLEEFTKHNEALIKECENKVATVNEFITASTNQEDVILLKDLKQQLKNERKHYKYLISYRTESGIYLEFYRKNIATC